MEEIAGDRMEHGALAQLAFAQSSKHVQLLLDPVGTVLAINEEIWRAEQWTPSDCIGHSHALFYSADEVAQGLPAADLETAALIGAHERELWRLRRSGTEYLARTTITALREDGHLRGFHVIARDITDEAAVRTANDTREQHLQSILDTVPDAMIVIDELGQILSFSAAAQRLFGYDEDEVVGRNVHCLMPSPDRERHDDYIRHYRNGGDRRIIGIGRTVTARRRDGTDFPIQLSVGEAGHDGDRVFTGFIRDLSQQERDDLKMRELQAELVHVSRLSAMGTMASTLAHELNQPLTAVANYLEETRDIIAEPGELPLEIVKEALSEAAKEVFRAGFIVRRLREFVARGEVNKSVENVPQIIDDAAHLALVGARERGIRTLLDLDPKAKHVLADKVQVQQVLVNLMSVRRQHLWPRKGVADNGGIGSRRSDVRNADETQSLQPKIGCQAREEACRGRGERYSPRHTPAFLG
ncbi:PAS domain S-box protein [Novosphingobium umbonatum]|uniref:Sensor protein FixL n=1 Tax=Novosphingobium umbonatum TaxID=1908524 RepID=A0A437N3T9_9SPHN|nr:PAS domain S-box protein [Novosphingobium umbonatum]